MNPNNGETAPTGRGEDTNRYDVGTENPGPETMTGDDAPTPVIQFDEAASKAKYLDSVASKVNKFVLDHISNDDAPVPLQFLQDTAVGKESKKKVNPHHRSGGPSPSAPRVSQLSSSSPIRDDSISREGTTDTIEVLEATLVQDPPVYDAVQVEEQREQSAEPPSVRVDQDRKWWKKRGCCVFAGLVFIIGGVASIIGAIFATQGRNEEAPDTPPSNTFKPTGSPVIKPPTSWEQTMKPTLKPVTQTPTAEATGPSSKGSTNRPTTETSCGSFVYPLLSPGECDNCWPRVAIDGANALVTSGATNIMIMTHAENGNFGRVAEWNDVVAKSKGAVAISGDVFVVGFAYNCGGCPGHVYAYEKSDDGGWNKSNSYISPSDAHANNIFEGSVFASNFGASVDLDGRVMIAGAPSQDGGGAAYIYVHRAKNMWTYRAKIQPPGYRWDLGRSVSVKSDSAATLVAIGDPWFGNNAAEELIGNDSAQRGAVFIQSYNITSGAILSEFRIHRKMGMAKTQGNDCKRWFGQSVELTKDKDLFVGCPHGDNNSGAAYFYEQSAYKDGEYTSSPQKILPSDGGFDGDQFGWDIAEDGGVVAIGTHMQTRGRVYVYTRTELGEWSEVAIIEAPDGEQYFGESLAMSGNTLVVSSRGNAFSYSLDGCTKRLS